MTKSAEVLTADLAESSATQVTYADPTTAGLEKVLAGVLADVVHVERVPVDSHFFEDLGADSLVMAQFCARVRKRPDLPPVSMKDIYRHPTISSLAAALTDTAPAPAEPPVPAPIEVVTPASTLQYVLCGTLQLLFFLGYTYLAAVVVVLRLRVDLRQLRIDRLLPAVGPVRRRDLPRRGHPSDPGEVGAHRPVEAPADPHLEPGVRPLLDRQDAGPIEPAGPLLVGSPLYVLYLRALGAKVGRGVAIFSPHVPVCTDLLTIGDGTVIRKDSFFSCYRAHAGLIQTGAVTLGKDVFIGETTVLDIDTSMGDGAQLGHTSSLHAGQAVPGGERWHGSPAQRTEVDYRAVDPARCGTGRRAAYTVQQLLNVLLLWVPLVVGGVDILLAEVPQLTSLGSASLAFTSWTFYRDALAASLVLFFGFVLVGLLVVVTVPRVLNLFIKPDKVYRLYGFHYSVHRAIARMTNRKFFKRLFGDSSYIVHYLLLPRVQAFPGRADWVELRRGGEARDPVPESLSAAGRWSLAGCRSSMPTSRARPSGCPGRRSGHAVSSGTRSPIPRRAGRATTACSRRRSWSRSTGRSAEGVGLLGSPSFEIPRTVERDNRFIHLAKRRRAAPPPRRQEQAQCWSPWGCSCCRVGSMSSCSPWSVSAPGPLPLVRCVGDRGDRTGRRRHPPVQRRLPRAGRTCRRRIPGLAADVLLDLPDRLLADGNAS